MGDHENMNRVFRMLLNNTGGYEKSMEIRLTNSTHSIMKMLSRDLNGINPRIQGKRKQFKN